MTNQPAARNTVDDHNMTPCEHLDSHPAAGLFPLMQGEDYETLKADIAENGLREPICLCDGKILDGRNRYRACRETNTEPRFVAYQGNDPLSFVVSLNLRRRHLSESQRGMIAAELANMRQGQRTDLELSANLHEVSLSQAADLLNVSRRTACTAKKVEQQGTPELVDAVKSGNVSVSAASEIANLPAEKQQAVVSIADRRERKKQLEREKAAMTPRNIPHDASGERAVKDAKTQVAYEDMMLIMRTFDWLADIEKVLEGKDPEQQAQQLFSAYRSHHGADYDRWLPKAHRFLDTVYKQWRARRVKRV